LIFSYIVLSDNRNGLNIKNPSIISVCAILSATLFILGMIFLITAIYQYKQTHKNNSKQQNIEQNNIKQYNYNYTEYKVMNSCFNYFSLAAIITGYFFILHHFTENILSNSSEFNLIATKNLLFLITLIVVEILIISFISYTIDNKINENREYNDQEKRKDNEYIIGSAISFLISSFMAVVAVPLCQTNIKLLILIELISAMFILSSLSVLCINAIREISTSMSNAQHNKVDIEANNHRQY